MKDILERLKSPVVWVSVLTAVYIHLETADFSTPRNIILASLGILIAAFSALNNPTDRDHM